MSIKSDRWIRRMAQQHAMIEPFEPGQIRENGTGRIISYGTSSYGYDIRCADEFKIFTNINSAIVDPKNFDASSFVDVKAKVCIIPPNSFALARTVEYFRIPRNVLTICLGKSTYARCFRGDTRVALVDGTAPTLEEMARRAEAGEQFHGYGISQSNRVMVALLEAPRFIGRDALMEIVLDYSARIHCTPDHEFMLRDGRMIKAHELRLNDALMPLYRNFFRDCEMLHHSSDGYFYPKQWLTGGWNIRHGNCQEQSVEDCFPEQHNFQYLPDMIGRLRGQCLGVNHRVQGIKELPGDHDVYCLTVPETGNFALEAGVFVSNCGIIVNVTPLEPEWEGHVTLEFSNTTPLPAKIYANEGVAQVLFLESDEVCETSYKDRGGKYQGQRGVTLPRT